jgi:hypothetical protein
MDEKWMDEGMDKQGRRKTNSAKHDSNPGNQNGWSTASPPMVWPIQSAAVNRFRSLMEPKFEGGGKKSCGGSRRHTLGNDPDIAQPYSKMTHGRWVVSLLVIDAFCQNSLERAWFPVR